jgi:hypothetical protein
MFANEDLAEHKTADLAGDGYMRNFAELAVGDELITRGIANGI